jgi:hypothetical protein
MSELYDANRALNRRLRSRSRSVTRSPPTGSEKTGLSPHPCPAASRSFDPIPGAAPWTRSVQLACAGGDSAGDLALVGDRRAAGGEGEQDGGPAPPEAEEIDVYRDGAASSRDRESDSICHRLFSYARVSERTGSDDSAPVATCLLVQEPGDACKHDRPRPLPEVSGRIGPALVDLDKRLDRPTALLELRSRCPGDREPREVEVDTGAIQPLVGRLWRRPAHPAGGEVRGSHRDSLRKRDIDRSQTLLLGPKATRLRRSTDEQGADEQQPDRSGPTHPNGVGRPTRRLMPRRRDIGSP